MRVGDRTRRVGLRCSTLLTNSSSSSSHTSPSLYITFSPKCRQIHPLSDHVAILHIYEPHGDRSTIQLLLWISVKWDLKFQEQNIKEDFALFPTFLTATGAAVHRLSGCKNISDRNYALWVTRLSASSQLSLHSTSCLRSYQQLASPWRPLSAGGDTADWDELIRLLLWLGCGVVLALLPTNTGAISQTFEHF